MSELDTKKREIKLPKTRIWYKLSEARKEVETLKAKVADLEKQLDEMSKDSFALIEEAKKVEQERIIKIINVFSETYLTTVASSLLIRDLVTLINNQPAKEQPCVKSGTDCNQTA